jgi:kanamycin kinase
VELDITSFPDEIKSCIIGSTIYDFSRSPRAKTYFIDRDAGYFLKVASKSALNHEAVMMNYFHSKGMTSRACNYISVENGDYLLMERIKGEPGIVEKCLNEPKKLAVVLGENLRRLHDINFDDCPKKGINFFTIPLAHKKYKEDNLDLWLLEYSDFNTREDAYEFLCKNENILVEDVCIHGDASLPNIILDNFIFSGFIDFDGAGIGDRHFDLMWAVWSLNFNLNTNEYKDRFLDAYGRDKFNIERYNLCIILRAFTFTESWMLRGQYYDSSI